MDKGFTQQIICSSSKAALFLWLATSVQGLELPATPWTVHIHSSQAGQLMPVDAYNFQLQKDSAYTQSWQTIPHKKTSELSWFQLSTQQPFIALDINDNNGSTYIHSIFLDQPVYSDDTYQYEIQVFELTGGNIDTPTVNLTLIFESGLDSNDLTPTSPGDCQINRTDNRVAKCLLSPDNSGSITLVSKKPLSTDHTLIKNTPFTLLPEDSFPDIDNPDDAHLNPDNAFLQAKRQILLTQRKSQYSNANTPPFSKETHITAFSQRAAGSVFESLWLLPLAPSSSNEGSKIPVLPNHIITVYMLPEGTSSPNGDTNNVPPSALQQGEAPAENGARTRRRRTVFTTAQLYLLESEFNNSPYPGRHHQEGIARSTGLDTYRVNIWFQNRRAKDRRKQNQQARRRQSEQALLPMPSCSRTTIPPRPFGSSTTFPHSLPRHFPLVMGSPMYPPSPNNTQVASDTYQYMPPSRLVALSYLRQFAASHFSSQAVFPSATVTAESKAATSKAPEATSISTNQDEPEYSDISDASDEDNK